MLHIDEIPTTEINTRGRWAVLALLAAITGCSDDPVSLGGAVAVDRSALSSYAAVWEGYVEAYTFESGSDRVRLVLEESGQGNLTLGEGMPRPMPTDPVVPFPELDWYLARDLLNETFHEGHPYEIRGASVEAERLRARTGPSNVYQVAACALQTPIDLGEVAPGDVRYRCMDTSSILMVGERCYVPDQTAAYEDQPLQYEISCQQWEVCTGCTCDATGCSAEYEQAPFVIDGALDATGTRLEGSLATPLGPHTVHLTKQP